MPNSSITQPDRQSIDRPGAISRRTMMVAGSILALGTTAAARPRKSLKADIDAYVMIGHHRCGTLEELRTANWFANRLRQSGFSAEIKEFEVSTILDPSGHVSHGPFHAAAFPQWLPPRGAWAGTIVAPLARLGEATLGKMVIAPKPFPPNAYWSAAQQAAVEAAARDGAKAMIFAADELTDSIYAYNQETRVDLPIPAVIVNKSALEALNSRSGVSLPASLTLSGRNAETSARYVLAHKPGVGAAIVVSTPLTGWFRCGAERGPGIALMIALSERLAACPRPIWLVGTGAHEIGHLGMKKALTSGKLPAPHETALWLHLGAGICARALDARYGLKVSQNLTVSKSIASQLSPAFASPDWTQLDAKTTSSGEAGDVISAGYDRLLGITAPFPGFHTPADDGSAVDYMSLARLENDLMSLIVSLA